MLCQGRAQPPPAGRAGRRGPWEGGGQWLAEKERGAEPGWHSEACGAEGQWGVRVVAAQRGAFVRKVGKSCLESPEEGAA